ncbi:hypothetical protein CGK74_11910 [Thauera propionica]|uniref:Uncharacterized protein n=1 Tax=Thauera propionica TaxID=2019431 RepID=A0A235EYJ9_9RHOO|nr:hypothetical protein [Thauera propionica]OYD53647.1 hypothetical protein CGK74_11910 [Thauera propionica]
MTSTELVPCNSRYIRRVSMDTEAQCYAAARIADKAMGEAFCVVLDAFITARSLYATKNDSTYGFLNEFVRETGLSLSYVKKISQIANTEGVAELVFREELGFNKAYQVLEKHKEQIRQQGLKETTQRIKEFAELHWHVAKGIEALWLEKDFDFDQGLTDFFDGMSREQAEKYLKLATHFSNHQEAIAHPFKVLDIVA